MWTEDYEFSCSGPTETRTILPRNKCRENTKHISLFWSHSCYITLWTLSKNTDRHWIQTGFEPIGKNIAAIYFLFRLPFDGHSILLPSRSRTSNSSFSHWLVNATGSMFSESNAKFCCSWRKYEGPQFEWNKTIQGEKIQVIRHRLCRDWKLNLKLFHLDDAVVAIQLAYNSDEGVHTHWTVTSLIVCPVTCSRGSFFPSFSPTTFASALEEFQFRLKLAPFNWNLRETDIF